MQQYIARRVILGILTGLLVSLLIFAILRIAPGDVAMMIALEMTGGEEDLITEEQLEKIREDIGLNAPLHMQYLTGLEVGLPGTGVSPCSPARVSGRTSQANSQLRCSW